MSREKNNVLGQAFFWAFLNYLFQLFFDHDIAPTPYLKSLLFRFSYYNCLFAYTYFFLVSPFLHALYLHIFHLSLLRHEHFWHEIGSKLRLSINIVKRTKEDFRYPMFFGDDKGTGVLVWGQNWTDSVILKGKIFTSNKEERRKERNQMMSLLQDTKILL